MDSMFTGPRRVRLRVRRRRRPPSGVDSLTTSSKGHTCVVGLAWGDEGKGKIVDLLCDDYDIVVRFNGGANAGHTVCIGPEKFALHLLPSGVLRPDKRSIIGPGVVVDPEGLLDEIDNLATRGVEVGDNLRISDRAHVVMPYHKLEDRLSESTAAVESQIGTTARGIGPCYADKMRRSTAIRICDLLNLDRLRPRLGDIVRMKRAALQAVYGQSVELDADAIFDNLRRAALRIEPYVTDTVTLLRDAVAAGDRILFEGANGTLLDVDHGTYPFVTSSGTTASGVANGAGMPARAVPHVVGVTKSYATRVGRGPFVTELDNEIGDRIRDRGQEYGTTTGRPRRCGWFDAVITRYAVGLSDVTEIALMHLDTLSGFERIGICTGYRLDGREVHAPPADPERLDAVEPVIETLPGWDEDLSGINRLDQLPDNARRYIQRIESAVSVPITIVSVGPERSQTIIGNTRTRTRASTTTSV